MQALVQLRQQLSARATSSPLWQRWHQMAPRERMALGLLGAFLIGVVLYLSIWQPAARELKDARNYYQQQRELNAYLQSNAEAARQVSAKPQVSLEAEQLQGLVTRTAQQHGLVVERFDSDSEGLLVSLAEAPFAAMLRWFGELQAQGVRLAEVSLDRASTGKVNARLTLKAGG